MARTKKPASPTGKRKQDESKDKGNSHPFYAGTGKKFLPTMEDDEEHPLPYFISPTTVLPRPTDKPWESLEGKRARRRIDRWKEDPVFQMAVVNDLVDDLLVEEMSTVTSVIMQEGKYKLKRDRVKASYIEEEIVPPVVTELCTVGVWELLYRAGRSLSDQEYEQMEADEEDLKIPRPAEAALRQHVMEQANWARDMEEEKTLGGVTWKKLVYNYSRIVRGLRISDNFATTQLQEQIVGQSAVSAVAGTANETDQAELQEVDEKEKVTRPPRQG